MMECCYGVYNSSVVALEVYDAILPNMLMKTKEGCVAGDEHEVSSRARANNPKPDQADDFSVIDRISRGILTSLQSP